MAVKGIQFATDTEDHKVAVVLDFKEWGELWQDIYDNLLADERGGEPFLPLGEFEEELRVEGLLE